MAWLHAEGPRYQGKVGWYRLSEQGAHAACRGETMSQNVQQA
jgi:hypothetical protein